MPDETRSYILDDERGEVVYLDDMRTWPHFYAFESHAGQIPRWQGSIQEEYADGSMRVWLYDWVIGNPDIPQIIRPSEYGDILRFRDGIDAVDWFCRRFHPYGSEQAAYCLRCGERRYQTTGSRMAPWDDGHLNAGFDAMERFR